MLSQKKTAMKNRNWLLAGLGLAAYYGAKALFEKIQEQKYTFDDKVVVITGSTRGLGIVMARKLAEQKARLVICARDEKELYEAEMELREKGAEVLAVKCDVSDLEQVRSMVDQTMERYGQVDVLINNAGNIVVSPYENNTIEDFDQLMKVHFYGPLNTVMAFTPYMRRQQEGRIVNISSIGGKYSVPHLLPYSASKFALTGLSEGMYAALKKDNIKVTTVIPWLMRTGSPRNVDVKGQYELEYKLFKTADSLPLLTQSAEGAAQKILKACQRGDVELILSLQGKLVNFIHGIFPGLAIKTGALINDRLPKGTDNPESKKGHQTRFEKERSRLTRMTDDAAAKNNEF
jgi:short-subunit dehydrogenase